MTTSHALLLLDDGELDSLADLLDRSSTPYQRLRGGEIPDELEPPTQLLVATPRHAGKVGATSSPESADCTPVRIIVAAEDSISMRAMMRERGFHYLVRLPAHPEVWRLLIQRSLYQGSERRAEIRLPVGSKIDLHDSATASDLAPASRRALLVDLSNRGCHLVTSTRLALDASVSFQLADGTGTSEAGTISGRVVRTTPVASGEQSAAERHSCAVLFDIDLPESARRRVAEMINARMTGPETLVPHPALTASLPTIPSPEFPGLALNDETDPPVSTDLEVDFCVAAMKSDSETSANRRGQPRGAYMGEVAVMHPKQTHVLIGRDLSAEGMRVEALPGLEIGDRMRIALYGACDAEPMLVAAEVARDDGAHGLALRFVGVSRETSRALEKLVAGLPPIESLEGDESDGVGTVLSEILPR